MQKPAFHKEELHGGIHQNPDTSLREKMMSLFQLHSLKKMIPACQTPEQEKKGLQNNLSYPKMKFFCMKNIYITR